MAHAEIIRPAERIIPELGGTGYQPPSVPATLADVVAAYETSLAAGATVPGMFVLKVYRDSVNWKKPAVKRRLTFVDGTCECVVIGSIRDWWFVSISL